MRVYRNFAKFSMLVLAFALMSTLSLAKTSEYKFKVHNNTKQAIKKLQVSPDGKKWGDFDIGDGIAAGATDELVWDKSTDNENCEQYFKVEFTDGEWSDTVKFKYCEKELVLEVNNEDLKSTFQHA